MARGFVVDTDERTRRIEARLKRPGNVLEREAPPRLWTIIDESALNCVIGGPGMMATQLSHLLELTASPNIDIQVLPHAKGMSQSFGFSILTFGENDRVVFVDVPPNGLFFEDSDDLLEHERAFDHLHAAALSLTESRSFMEALTNEYKKA